MLVEFENLLEAIKEHGYCWLILNQPYHKYSYKI